MKILIYLIILSLSQGVLPFPTVQARSFGDCTADWMPFLSVDPNQPKYLSGDTLAAYGLYMFKMNRRNDVQLILEGSPYAARFWSIETYLSRTQIKTDHIFDRDVRVDADGKFRIHLAAGALGQRATNQLELADPRILNRVYSIMLRIYLPNRPLSDADLPRIYAVDSRTGRPTSCPEVHVPIEIDLPQPLVTLRDIRREEFLTFGKQPAWFDRFGLGGNSAVPDYRQATVRMDRPSDVAVIRFRAPGFGTHRDAETRYWSLCVQNFGRNTTLACLPDYLARIDDEGFVTMVFAKHDPRVIALADEFNFNFIEDQRDMTESIRGLQRVVGFVYRNLMPSRVFSSRMYQGPYLPVGRICSVEEFLAAPSRHQACW